MPKDILLERADIMMWGAFACAQPWMAAEKVVPGIVFLVLGACAWFVGKWIGDKA